MDYIKSLQMPNLFNIVSGNTNIVKNVDAINNLIYLFLTTSKGELFGDPNFGCNLRKYIFDFNNEALQYILKDEIVQSLQVFQPLITLFADDITIEIDEENENKITIGLLYKINATGESTVYNLVMTREVE